MAATITALSLCDAVKDQAIMGRGMAIKWRYGVRSGMQTTLLPLMRIIHQVDDEAGFKVLIDNFLDANAHMLQEPSSNRKGRCHRRCHHVIVLVNARV